MRTGAGIAVAMGVMNVATYGFTMLAARLLGPQAYGALRRRDGACCSWSRAPARAPGHRGPPDLRRPRHVGQIEREILRVTYRAALGLGLLLLVLTPVINPSCGSTAWSTAALVAVAAVPLTMMGGQAGILQGERRWLPLAVLYLAGGRPALVIGTALMLWRAQRALGACSASRSARSCPVVVGWWALRRRPRATPAASTARTSRRPAMLRGDAPQLPGAARLLRAVQRRHRSSPATSSTSTTPASTPAA